MRLHSGIYLWPETVPNRPQYPALSEDISCDCLIVGGGIGGALCANLLSKKGVKTVLIDKREIASGSTLTNTGLLQYSSDKTLSSFIQTFGEETAVHFYRLSQRALVKLQEISSQFEPNARLIPRSSLYLASTLDDVDVLREEFETLRRFQFPAEWWDEDMIRKRFPFTRPAAIYTYGDAEVNPLMLVHELIQEASSNGVRVYEHSNVNGFQFHENDVKCRSGKWKITAKHIIFATGYETQQFKKDQGANLTSSYVTVTEPVQDFNDWYQRCLIWETARPYSYLRTTPDGRIISGGLDEHLPGGVLEENRYIHQSKKLLNVIHTMFPRKAALKSEYAWGAVFGGTRDGLPYIGPHPDYPHCYFLEGYGGNGTVCSMIAAEMITDVLTGIHRPDMEIFSLMRTSKPNRR
ncbi:glycine/D-amino acid oxidase-like deaminating enzyme [Paenibacillus anaericanus]|uniref:NAD(P)/FAD-dependent oxidoreductase n=1 Tax=Paenibacillus anaericanus TaxID=170367 RepID=UPI0027867559|nr:FAD-dependent oxidoreductase [Paenibacillus anaericanus]MDQ0087177.1 glycine/D-amino acid oxidase-like deaminating enzyme [Paenibacillus anaericanus]